MSEDRFVFLNKLALRNRSLASERLVLRPFEAGDRDAVLRLFYNEEIRKTYMIPEFRSENDAVGLFQRMKKLSNGDEHFIYAAVFDGGLIGFINDTCVETDSIELGWVIDPDYKNRGFATEMLRTAVVELFRLGFATVKAGCFEENIASRRVMEKSGMRLNGKTETVEYRGRKHRCLCLEIRRNG